MSSPHPQAQCAGFSLIELMISLTLALFLTIVVVGAITTAGNSARAQTEASRLQENAGHALRMISRDIRRAASSYCLNYAATDAGLAPDALAHVDERRPIEALFDATVAPIRLGRMQPAPSARYFIDPAELLLGSECALDGNDCTPEPEQSPARYAAGDMLPPVAFPPAPGRRVRGADVLTMRFLEGPGVAVTDIANADPGAGQAAAVMTLADDSLASAQRVLAVDCAVGFVARVSGAGNLLTLTADNFGGGLSAPSLNTASARAFDLDTDFVTVSYYLRFDADVDDGSALVSTLVRRVGNEDEVVADGIERIDFLYHVELADGRTRVLSGADVHAMTACRGLALPSEAPVAPAACGWRSLKGVEVFLLAASPRDLPAMEARPHRYAWNADGSPNGDGSLDNPDPMPSGLPAGRKLRREFRTYVAMRGMNP